MNQILREHILDMLRYSREVVWCVDVNTFDLLYTNEACFNVWGYTPREMMDDKNIFFSHLHPEDIDIYKKGWDEAIKNGRSRNEFRIFHKDGSIKVIKGDAIFMKGKDGFPDTMTGIATDITEERRLNDNLILSEKKFHSIADDTPVMMWTSHAGEGLNYVNKAWIEFTGKDMDALRGKDWMNLLHPDDLERIRQNRQSYYTTPIPFEVEARFQRKDGVYRTVLMQGAPQFDSSDVCIGFVGSGVDITEIRDLNQKFQDSELRFKSIANNSPMLMWTSNTEGACTFFNITGQKFCGLSEEGLLGDGWVKLIHPDDIGQLAELRKVHFHSQTPFEMECRMINRNGDYRWMQVINSPQFNSKNEFTGFVGTGFDVTEIKILNQKLYESELRFKSIANDSPILMWTVDADKQSTFFNTSWVEFSGMKEEQLKRDGWIKLVHPDDVAKLHVERDIHFSLQSAFEIECRIKRKDGAYRWIHLKESPQFNSKDEFTGFVGNGIDMTDVRNHYEQVERTFKELKSAMEESRRLLRIVNKTKNIIVLTDATGKITYVNEAFTKTTGYTLSEALGKKPGNLVQGPETDPNTIALFRQAIAKGEMVKAEILNYAKDGRKYWLDVRIEPIYTEDVLTGFMAIEIDITQRKLDEKVISETNKRIRQFSFITSHELRHEFSKIMLLLHASKMQDNDVQDVKSYFAELEEPINKINTIIQHMNENLAHEIGTDYSTINININEIEEICLVDDDRLINLIHQRLIKKMLPDIQLRVFDNPDAALEYLRLQPSLKRLIFLDLNFPDNTGWHFMDEYVSLDQKNPVIILSSSIDNEDREKSRTYKEVIDFFIKPLTLDTLQKVFGRAQI